MPIHIPTFCHRRLWRFGLHGSSRKNGTKTPFTSPKARLYRLNEPSPVLDSDLLLAEEEMPLSQQVLIELCELQQQDSSTSKAKCQALLNTIPKMMFSPLELSGNTATPSNDKDEDTNNVLEAARVTIPLYQFAQLLYNQLLPLPPSRYREWYWSMKRDRRRRVTITVQKSWQ